MRKQVLSTANDGFYGIWYPNKYNDSSRGTIIMLGDDSGNRMVRGGVKWAHRKGLHALAVSPEKKEKGRHNEPLERIGKAIDFLTAHDCKKIAICGASATGMMALLAASYYPQISLTIALAPADFVMEGYYRDGADGAPLV